MANSQIVKINVTQTLAPIPNNLQQKAAIVSMNSTILGSGNYKWITGAGQLASLLSAAVANASVTWAAGIVTITYAATHGLDVGDVTPLNVIGVTPAGYNGQFTATATTTTALTYSLPNNGVSPGTVTVVGTSRYDYQAYLIAADQTWWAQPSNVPYMLFETGYLVPLTAVPVVQTYLTNYPQSIYHWVFLPGVEDDPATMLAFFNLYNNLNSLIKFYMGLDYDGDSTFWGPNPTLKNVMAFTQYIGDIATSLSTIPIVNYMTAFIPSPTNKLPPTQFTYGSNVSTATAFMRQSAYNDLVSWNVNFYTTGAEGGISNVMLVPGRVYNGTPLNVTYSIDWVQINLDLDVSNAVINGSNNPESPLYYNQDGINFLQQVMVKTANRAIQSGLALGQVIQVGLSPSDFAANVQAGTYNGNFVINAVPFKTYVALNPSDYANQLYSGFQVAYTPQYGFFSIVFNLNVVQFA